MTSLTGKTYKVTDQTKLVSDDGQVSVIIRSRDSYYADENRSFKRLIISNCLDARYYDQEES